MGELLEVVDAFSMPIKVGWVVWLAWGVGQVFWYRHERKPRVHSTRVVPPPSRRSAAVRTPTPVVHRMITPEPTHVPSAVADSPAFDPSSAVVETFGATARELDSFVAGFEKNTRQRRQVPHQPEHSGALGTESSGTM
jgi:hypothetical protein